MRRLKKFMTISQTVPKLSRVKQTHRHTHPQTDAAENNTIHLWCAVAAAQVVNIVASCFVISYITGLGGVALMSFARRRSLINNLHSHVSDTVRLRVQHPKRDAETSRENG